MPAIMVWLARHGETEANAARIVQRPEIPLSARGRRQAEALARRLAEARIRLVLSSDLRRAMETAEIVAGLTGVPLELDTGLRERDFGAVRGTPYASLSDDIFAPGYLPPGGESWEAFHARVDEVWRRVLTRAADGVGDIAVVTHGLVVGAVLRRHCDPPAGVEMPLACPNAAVSLIVPPRRIALFACTAHLVGDASGGVV